MKFTWADRMAADAINTERCQRGATFLENLPFCNGRAVIVKAKFDVAGKESNRLLFTTVRPFDEKIKTLQKIYDVLSFPVNTLWKARLMKTAVHKEPFYIIGYIKVIYENGSPKGTLTLAEDIFRIPILTERQFTDNYPKFCNLFYKWPRLGEMKKAMLPLAKRMRSGATEKYRQNHYLRLTVWNRLLSNKSRCRKTQIKSWEDEQKTFLLNEVVTRNNELPASKPIPVQKSENVELPASKTILAPQLENVEPLASKPTATPELLPLEETKKTHTLPITRNGSKLDSSIRRAAELGHIETEPELASQKKPQAGELQLLKDYLEENSIKIGKKAKLNAFNSPLGRQWLLEFSTAEKRVVYKECTCQFSEGIIYIDSEVEQWLIRYSELFGELILYHKNKKGYRINTDREPIRGYHVQHVQSLFNVTADEMHEFEKPQEEKCGSYQNYNGAPTIKDYLKYICEHRELTIARNKREKRKRKELRDMLKDRNTSYESKQKKRKKLRKEIEREKARDVLHLLQMLKGEEE